MTYCQHAVKKSECDAEMGKQMKKIALIMDGWKRYFTYAWPAGILKRIRETKEEVNLYIFTSSGNWSQDEDYTLGEYNIYRLPDLSDFDGIILDLNNITQDEVREELVSTVEKLNKPVISIGREVSDFYFVGIDNRKAMTEVIAHLHHCHDCKKFWFVMGPTDHYENIRRVEALRAYMQENDLEFSEDDFYFESFEYRCGVRGFQKLYEREGKLPDAIVCANDNIAIGVCEAAKNYGLTAPEDFLVTGFDNFDKASFYVPRISTMEHIREEVGYYCADVLIRHWAGEDVPRVTYTSTNGIFRDSCGCQNDVVTDSKMHLKSQILYGVESEEFNEDVLALEYELLQCNTIKEMMKCIPQCIPAMKCDAMYLVLDEHIDIFKNQPGLSPDENLMNDEEGFQSVGYPESMQVKFAYEDSAFLDIDGMRLKGIFPMFDYAKSGKSFLFLPVHFRSKTVGYFVIRNAIYLMEKQYLFPVIKALTTAMENLHQKEKLEYMNQMLSDLYVKDALTGLYNRFGYQKFAEEYFQNMHNAGNRVLIMFLDLDRLKYINDNFGHEWGDFAIISIANAMKKHCLEGAVPARTGGDEFVLVQKADSEKDGDILQQNINKELARIAEKSHIHFELSVSIGYVVTSPDENVTMEEYVSKADENMYNSKVQKKANREG